MRRSIKKSFVLSFIILGSVMAAPMSSVFGAVLSRSLRDRQLEPTKEIRAMSCSEKQDFNKNKCHGRQAECLGADLPPEEWLSDACYEEFTNCLKCAKAVFEWCLTIERGGPSVGNSPPVCAFEHGLE